MTQYIDAMTMQFAAIVCLDQPSKSGSDMASVNGTAEVLKMIVAAEAACGEAGVAELGPKFAIVGSSASAGELAGKLAGDGWRVIVNPSPERGVVPGLRVAMRALPLVDAFWLAAMGAGSVTMPQPTLFPGMARAYESGRLKLKRIVIPASAAGEGWPWLVDIGFRQPFVELADDGNPWSVVEANRSQVEVVKA